MPSIELSKRYTTDFGQPYIEHVALDTSYIAELLGDFGLEEVWLKAPDMNESYPLLYPRSLVNQFLVPVFTAPILNHKVVLVYLDLTKSLIRSLTTCRLRFEVKDNRVQTYLVNLSGKKKLLKG